MALIIDDKKCVCDCPCRALKSCPLRVLSQRDCSAPEVDKKRCISCGKCTRACPKGALRVMK
ncbi:MAG: 4Fe-4S binding protein [Coriobacteriaceae bacterium]|nr:4Fe-4S binding protein [Coriobacteriaceae bacterium]